MIYLAAVVYLAQQWSTSLEIKMFWIRSLPTAGLFFISSIYISVSVSSSH